MSKVTKTMNEQLKKVTGVWFKNCAEWLRYQQCGCCRLEFASDEKHIYSVCVGWHDCGSAEGWKTAWKIGRQTLNNGMQSDLDVDFELPYDPKTGDCYDTTEVFDGPMTLKRWNAMAVRARKAARSVWREFGVEA